MSTHPMLDVVNMIAERANTWSDDTAAWIMRESEGHPAGAMAVAAAEARLGGADIDGITIAALVAFWGYLAG